MIDVLDLVMKGRIDQVLDFVDPATVNGSLAAPGAPFGRLLAAAFDEAMTPNEWAAFTATTAEAVAERRVAGNLAHARHAAIGFAARYGVVVKGLP